MLITTLVKMWPVSQDKAWEFRKRNTCCGSAREDYHRVQGQLFASNMGTSTSSVLCQAFLAMHNIFSPSWLYNPPLLIRVRSSGALRSHVLPNDKKREYIFLGDRNRS
ncbi:hypothetical protein CDAR_207181 [Caerostris darwini]|uniref:Uncharacterized protein n=1 Tax=Caerostris darwini TaxID=1538125 RepID=A0AAV4SLA6_9ARAC|nr:hypothetical protein CDAR_207181 [Caerostris darwini]